MKHKYKKIIVHLLRLNNTPHEVALGAAIGVFIAILPFYGFHTLMVLVAAVLIKRANKIAILVGTNISLPPTVPFITWTAYDIGRFMLGKQYPPLVWSDFKNITFQKVADKYPALLAGSFILGIICAIIFYFLTYNFVKVLRKRKEHARRARNNHKKI